MKKLLSVVLLLVVAFNTRPLWEEYAEPYVNLAFMDVISDELEDIRESSAVTGTVDRVTSEVKSLVGIAPKTVERAEQPALAAPESQTFSVYNIQIGDSRSKVEQEVGAPKRHSQNEYGTEWYAYHENYQNFLMVSYDEENRVNGLYTNHNLISSKNGIALNIPQENVREKLGEPMDKMRKGLTYYILNETNEHDYYHMDDSYVTIFYDVHEQDTVTAILILDEDLEAEKKGMYGENSAALRKGFEYQLFDVTNAARVVHGLPVLTWDDPVSGTAREHSQDMAQHVYFDHTNLEGQSPFDRMEEDRIHFTTAGENLAYGQFSSIFAHEGLMNSAGHRKNILNGDFHYLGVGVALNGENQPYFTENFFNN
ncbi:CAP domain-containing protein [Domibacillus indicus]|uniref:CAP domain-containing protein n=1 Tax=Domibacillus indicus TaxID=1437523 RepID=UPI0020404449|nr:CAP domain-containing protein [Domibacillus indicus]MCM3789588.1 CAP domain-containing protein [Domibacillus indicus]